MSLADEKSTGRKGKIIKMKFVHIADMHFDAPFSTFSEKQEFGKVRRIEQRNIFEKIISYIKENEIPFFFISGDFYEHEFARQSTIEYVNSLFKTIPNTKIFISPGNHDPFLKNSFYNTFNWNKNVTIFGGKLTEISLDDVNIFGYGFTDFYSDRVDLKVLNLDKEKINILIMHGSIDSSENLELQYNPISHKDLEALGFDYVALGHIHKKNYIEEKKTRIIYPGSTISLGFDELGSHGMIVGDISKDNLDLKFIKLDPKTFEEMELNITDTLSEDALIQEINNLTLDENVFYKIILTGKRKFEINIVNIKKLISQENIIKIKNLTKPDFNIEEISKRTTLSRNVCKRNFRRNEEKS